MSSNTTNEIDEDARMMNGTLVDEYQIYVDCAKSLNWEIKSFDEWLNS